MNLKYPAKIFFAMPEVGISFLGDKNIDYFLRDSLASGYLAVLVAGNLKQEWCSES